MGQILECNKSDVQFVLVLGLVLVSELVLLFVVCCLLFVCCLCVVCLLMVCKSSGLFYIAFVFVIVCK